MNWYYYYDDVNKIILDTQLNLLEIKRDVYHREGRDDWEWVSGGYLKYDLNKISYEKQLWIIYKIFEFEYHKRAIFHEYVRINISFHSLKRLLTVLRDVEPLEQRNWTVQPYKKKVIKIDNIEEMEKELQLYIKEELCKRFGLDPKLILDEYRDDNEESKSQVEQLEIEEVVIDKFFDKASDITKDTNSYKKVIIEKDNRVIENGQEIDIVYKSGKKVKGRVTVKDDLVLIEGTKYGTAAWIVSIYDIKDSVLDLTKVDAIRMVHTETNIAEMKAIFGI